MFKTFSDAVNEIMPLVKSGSDLPFAITREDDGKWRINYFTLNTAVPKAGIKAQTASHLAFLRETDPYAVSHTGMDFNGGSFAFVHDKMFCARLRAEYNAVPFGEMHEGEFMSLLNAVEDKIDGFSQKAIDYLSEFDQPLRALYDLNPIPLYDRSNPDEPYNAERAAEFMEAVEYKIAELIDRPNVELVMPRESDKEERHGGDTTKEHNPVHTLSKIEINGYGIEIGENAEQPEPFYVETSKDGASMFSLRTADLIAALEAYSGQINERAAEWQREMEGSPPLAVMTSENCLQDGSTADSRAGSAQQNFRKEPDEQGRRVLESADGSTADSSAGSAQRNFRKKADFTGQLVIIDAETLSPEYRSSESQIVRCLYGNGARADAIGTSVFCRELYSGMSVVYGRHQILGIAEEEKLPQWAKAKLAALREPGVFEFRGFHFKPYRTFKYGEVDRQLDGDSRLWKTDAPYHFRNMGSDPAMQSLKSENLHKEFYSAAANPTVDIFVCVENSKLYVPGGGELFLYKEPSEEELRVAENKALKEYGTVMDAAIQEGAEKKSVPYSLEILDARFGAAKTNELLATVALTSLKTDGRISHSRMEWAKSVMGDTHDLKTIYVKSHPAHFDNLIMCAVQRDKPEQEKSAQKAAAPSKPEKPAKKPQKKPSILSGLDAAIAEAAQLAERKGGSHTKKRGNLEVD